MAENDNQSSREKAGALRRHLKTQGLDGFIVPRGDEYLGEYVPPSAERLAWLTDFTGSAGTAVVLENKAALVTDGRYTSQAGKQLDKSVFEITNLEDVPLSKWLAANAAPGAKIGFDPRLHTEKEIADLREELESAGIELVPVAANPIDALWKNRPAPPTGQIEIFPVTISGKTVAEKRDEIVKQVNEKRGAAVIIAKPESIAWLLNIRGSDVPHTPVALSHAVVHENGDIDWFVDDRKVVPAIRQHLGNRVSIKDPGTLAASLAQLAVKAKAEGKPVYTDKDRTPIWFKTQLEAAGAKVKSMQDPCVLPRASKTPEEQQSIINAHIRDGVAVTRFLKWADDNLAKGGFTELDVVARLRQFREQDPAFRDDSFDTIAGWAGNGAVIHYRATQQEHAGINPPGILLLDSGAQYEDGTTDITRTITVGRPAAEVKQNFTRVLKGHIAIATAHFPAGTTGSQLDILARKPLWDASLDYDHGTGHGVGCFLSVHEEASGIAKRSRDGDPGVRAGMLISNEPGFYKKDEYGIRIESLVLAKEAGKRRHTDRDVTMLEFETVTLAPIDKRLIEPDLMDQHEIDWLNDYHERVYQTLSPYLDLPEQKWLRDATAPIKKNPGLSSDYTRKTGTDPGPGGLFPG